MVQLLGDVRAKLHAQPTGTRRRDRLGKLESLQFAVDRWQAFPPRPEQIAAMLEVLLMLHDSSDTSRSRAGH